MRWSASDAESGLRNCLVELVSGGASTPVSTACSGQVELPVAQNGGHLLRLTAWDNVANRAVQEQVVAVSSVTKYYYHGSTRIAMRKGGQVYYLHGDRGPIGRGSTSLTTDSAGQVVQEARYLPYGQVRWEHGASTTDFGFTGQRDESAFGLMNFNARYYTVSLAAQQNREQAAAAAIDDHITDVGNLVTPQTEPPSA